MKKKRLAESMELVLSVEPNLHVLTEHMVSEWGGIPYPQLSVVLVHLKYLAALHQNHHWTAMGDPYYGDHLLFQRLYDGVDAEIDLVAEKSIGLGCTSNVDLNLVHSQLLKLVSGQGSATMIPQSSDLAKKSLMAEMNFLAVMKHLCDSIKDCGLMTNGLDKMLAGIEDKHEGHVYLLKQRISKPLI
jgi:DNA-binding ferritin-like protein